MEVLGLTFASGWASGVNAYATVLLLGLAGKLFGVPGIPEGFQRTDVLAVMGILTLAEFLADKVPYVDSAWDAISTLIRPVAGAIIGALIAGATGDLPTLALAAVGGVTALVSHAVKTGIRLAVNTSPEPLSNLGVSLTSDLAVVTVVTLAVIHPIAAALVAAVLLAIAIGLAVFLLDRIRRGWQALWRWASP